LKLAIGYSTKDSVELTEQTFPQLKQSAACDIYWCDGSVTDAGRAFVSANAMHAKYYDVDVRGGPDSAIAWKLSKLLAASDNYTHIGLLESDVMLDDDWLHPTTNLFEKGKADGLEVGAVSPRCYADRVLIQRDGYACVHNIGAGAIIFTRQAAEIVLRTFRTGCWQDNVKLFAQLSGIDLRTYAAFRGNEQFITTDWTWEAQLARHGLAALALTPSKVQMIGQHPPLEQQGLVLATGPVEERRDEAAFELFSDNLKDIRDGYYQPERPGMIHRDGAGMMIFPHQMKAMAAFWQGSLELQATQGFGPFAYRAGPGGATLSGRVSGTCSYLVSGGVAGAQVTIEDHRSGFKTQPILPPDQGQPVSIGVPGGPVPRPITVRMDEGAVFHGLQCADPQMIDTTFRFSWDQLPEAV
jgi:hypothetical protein